MRCLLSSYVLGLNTSFSAVWTVMTIPVRILHTTNHTFRLELLRLPNALNHIFKHQKLVIVSVFFSQ
jgi:hypothetical protein